jgi:predicted nucleotidyltransferase
MRLLTAHIEEIRNACVTNKVRTLFAFGSVTNDKFKSDSDVDLVVDIAETDSFAYSENYFNLKVQLEQIFNRHVDLLEQMAIRNSFIKSS